MLITRGYLVSLAFRLASRNKVDGDDDMYLYFDTSSAMKDVGQTTVPYLDAQPVSPKPATWLAGAGLYHKVNYEKSFM